MFSNEAQRLSLLFLTDVCDTRGHSGALHLCSLGLTETQLLLCDQREMVLLLY